MKVIKYLTILILPVTVISCSKNCTTFYSFEIPCSIYPMQNKYNVGDTIWFEINTSDNLYDKLSESNIDVNDNILTVQNLIYVYGTNLNTQKLINYYDEDFMLVSNDVFINYKDDKYFYKVAFILTEKGVCKIEAGMSSVKKSGKTIEIENNSKCKHSKIISAGGEHSGIDFLINNLNTVKNDSILINSTSLPNSSENKLNDFSTYYFVVE